MDIDKEWIILCVNIFSPYNFIILEFIIYSYMMKFDYIFDIKRVFDILSTCNYSLGVEIISPYNLITLEFKSS